MGADEFWEKVGESRTGEGIIKGYDIAYTNPAGARSPESREHVDLNNAVGEEKGWLEFKDGAYLPIAMSCKHIGHGCYRAVSTDRGVAIQRMPLATDKILDLPDSQSRNVVAEITKFKERAHEFKKRGLLHKRGILLWGPPGSGKTCTISMLIKLLVEEHKGIALFIEHPGLASEALRMIRMIEPERQIVGIMEDIDSLIQIHGESQYLALMDGESQVDNIVYVATTNYPERLDKRFVDRPSRFDTITWVGMPSGEARRMYLEHHEDSWGAGEVDEIVESTEGFSLAHLREVLILIKCLGNSVSDSLARVGGMRKKKLNSEDDPNRQQVGFGRG